MANWAFVLLLHLLVRRYSPCPTGEMKIWLGSCSEDKLVDDASAGVDKDKLMDSTKRKPNSFLFMIRHTFHSMRRLNTLAEILYWLLQWNHLFLYMFKTDFWLLYFIDRLVPAKINLVKFQIYYIITTK